MITQLKIDSEKFAFPAEDKLNFAFLSKANAQKRATVEKEEILNNLKAIKQKLVEKYGF